MKRFAGHAALILLAGLLAAQLIRPEMSNPPVNPARNLWRDPHMNLQVAGILRRACGDCHSNETEWPWYAKISPLSWMVARHVSNGRAKLNFSDWSTPSADQKEEIYDSIAKNKMPMASYLAIHPQARLSAADRDVLLAWVDGKLTGPH